MSKFLTDRWTEITSMTGGQWLLVVLFSLAIGGSLFKLFNWLYEQRFKALKDVADLQDKKLQLYAGTEPKTDESTQDSTQILPPDWEPYLDQPIDYLKAELEAWEGGQQGANRNSADIAFILDAKLLDVYVRLYESLEPSERVAFRHEQAEWLKRRFSRAQDSVESHGGSLAPLEFNMEFIEATEQRIEELQTRLKQTKG
jgi:uncharacterized protein YecT (DUF1311 family)